MKQGVGCAGGARAVAGTLRQDDLGRGDGDFGLRGMAGTPRVRKNDAVAVVSVVGTLFGSRPGSSTVVLRGSRKYVEVCEVCAAVLGVNGRQLRVGADVPAESDGHLLPVGFLGLRLPQQGGTVGVLVFTRLKFLSPITLLVDDTLAHKRGKSVWGLGWFRDACASTKKRVATAPGHNWVVLAVAVCLPATGLPILALPLIARLHRPGKGQPSCSVLAKQMLALVLEWFPTKRFTLVGDGAYASKELLGDLDQRVTFVGRLRGDAAVYDRRVPAERPRRRGRKPHKGPRLPKPKEAAAKADRKRTPTGNWLWQAVEVVVYGCTRSLRALTYEVVWPTVAKLRPLQMVVVRDPEGRMRDAYLFTTDTQATPAWVITQFAWRWSIESTFSMTKAKFGHAVRSKIEPAMKNEVLCKFLCHNLCCVIMSQAELGIESVIWRDDGDGDAVILPLARPR